MLRALEAAAGHRSSSELFDYAVGSSTGAIISLALCGARIPADEMAHRYVHIGTQMFDRQRTKDLVTFNRFLGDFSRFDERFWESLLKCET